ncbi:MAG: hypothetical protein ACI4C4_13810, partial [Lachnospiraceae bacterium]
DLICGKAAVGGNYNSTRDTTAHPQIKLYPINMLPEVGRMIRHVGRGNLPENVCLSKAGYE